MANNCYNYIQIEGNEQEIKELFLLLQIEKGKDSGCDIYLNLKETFKEYGTFSNDAN